MRCVVVYGCMAQSCRLQEGCDKMTEGRLTQTKSGQGGAARVSPLPSPGGLFVSAREFACLTRCPGVTCVRVRTALLREAFDG